MKRIALIWLLLSSPALGAEKYTYQLTPNEIGAIGQGLGGLEGYTKIIKDERGQEVAKPLPFAFKDNGVRMTIAQDIANVRAAITVFQAAAKGLSESEINELATKKQSIDLLQIDIDALAIDANPYSPNVLSLLLPIMGPAK